MDIIKSILKLNWKMVGKSDQKRIDSQTPTPGIRQILDIPYLDDGEKGHLLDIYYPEGTTEKLPVIIDIHGGGWMYGYKEINKYYCLKLASKGFLVASLNYRLVDDVLFPDQVRDIFAALCWLSENLASYPADLDNVFLTGDSAGGHLSCVTAAVCLNKVFQNDFGVTPPSFGFNAVGVVSPAVDLSSNGLLKLMKNVLLGKDGENAAFEKYMNIGRIADNQLAPFYIITSSGDFIRQQSYELKAILDKVGVTNTLSDYVVLVNGKKLQHVFSVTDPYSGPGERAVCEITDFFKSHIKIKA